MREVSDSFSDNRSGAERIQPLPEGLLVLLDPVFHHLAPMPHRP
jgi:hypothetical protein